MNQQKTARERAETALRHMPIMLIAKEAVITVVEVEIKSAISDTLEEAAKVCDQKAKSLGDIDSVYSSLTMGFAHQASACRYLANAIRALKD